MKRHGIGSEGTSSCTLSSLFHPINPSVTFISFVLAYLSSGQKKCRYSAFGPLSQIRNSSVRVSALRVSPSRLIFCPIFVLSLVRLSLQIMLKVVALHCAVGVGVFFEEPASVQASFSTGRGHPSALVKHAPANSIAI